MRIEYLCENFVGMVVDNDVWHWQGVGVDLFQSTDVLFKCNAIDSNYTGVHYYRDDGFLQPWGRAGDVGAEQPEDQQLDQSTRPA